MVENPTYYALVNPVPGLPEAEQRAIISAKFTPKEWYVVGKDGDFDQLHKLMRPGRVWLVAYTGLLAEHRGSKQDRVDSMVATKVLIQRKSYFVEASSVLRSDKYWKKLRPGGEEMCRRLAQGSKSALNALKGQPPYEFTNEQLVRLDRAMKRKYDFDPKRTPDDRRLAVVATLCQKWRKPTPGRTWLKTKLPMLIIQRGLSD